MDGREIKNSGKRLLNIHQVMMKLSCSRSYVYKLMRDEGLPKSIHLSWHSARWVEEEIDDFISKHMSKRGDL